MIRYFQHSELLSGLLKSPSESQDFVLLISGAISHEGHESLQPYLDEAVRILRDGGLLFVQGDPENLPGIGIYLDQILKFKYWIAIESETRYGTGLPTVHAGILMFNKGNAFKINRVRTPHRYCHACKKPLRDWGGKTHLMHPDGVAISDVWNDIGDGNNYTALSEAAIDRIIQLTAVEGITLNGVIGPSEGIRKSNLLSVSERKTDYRILQFPLPGFDPTTNISTNPQLPEDGSFPGWNVILHGDATKILKEYPDNSIDLVFADPPYNLAKAYNIYEDEKDKQAYLSWCNTWLEECIRVLKPTGSLFLLNLPRWGMYHAAYLNRRLNFQNWIVWDAMSEPRGKIMPAHYALLFYSKHPTNFTFNFGEEIRIDARFYCLRPSCIRRRKMLGDDDKELLTDYWWDIHRIKHRRDRDYHPCQLPDQLMERIISLTTKPGDIVLDPLAGTGTTVVAAARLGRRYVGIDIDEMYINIMRDKLAQIQRMGTVQRKSISKPRSRYSKKALQIELREIALHLGRLPTPEDVRQLSRFGLDAFLETFPTWGKALKAAKLEIENGHRSQ